jgi:hypothetical protein
LIALSGPGAATFTLARAPTSAGESAGAARAYLERSFAQLRAGSRSDWRADGRVRTRAFPSGVTAAYLAASAAGPLRLVVALLDAGTAERYLAVIAAPEAQSLLPLFVDQLNLPGPAALKDAGTALSLDGQFSLEVGGGLSARPLKPAEKDAGAVLAVSGAASEVVFMKLSPEDSAPKDQAAIVRAACADAAKVSLTEVSRARRAPTAAGPGAAYAWAKVRGESGQRFAAAFLPWQYWGYSILARGPAADELLVGVLAALKQGPATSPTLVAASPQVELPSEFNFGLWATLAAAAALALLVAWSRRRKTLT